MWIRETSQESFTTYMTILSTTRGAMDKRRLTFVRDATPGQASLMGMQPEEYHTEIVGFTIFDQSNRA